MQNEKFIAPFIEFIRENFDFNEHFFIIIGGLPESKHPIPTYKNVMVMDRELIQKKHLLKYSSILKPHFEKAQKVIIHSLFIPGVIDYLFINRRFAKKSYWVIWGGDLYSFRKKSTSLIHKFFRFRKKTVISNLAGFLTFIEGDYELAKKWWGAKGKYYQCIVYPSNFFKNIEINSKKNLDDSINIQIGNSADPSNNHMEILHKLAKYKDHNIKIIVPLSYGNQEYANKIIEQGNAIFGEKFKPLVDFMPFDEYVRLLGQIDIAIFNHDRQQAMGNIITLLGLGKKIYLKKDTTPWKTFKNLNITVYDIEKFNITPIENQVAEDNKLKIKKYFSKENAVKELKKFFLDQTKRDQTC